MPVMSDPIHRDRTSAFQRTVW